MTLTVDQLLRLNGFTSDEEQAYRAGFDSAMNGANTDNCHFRHFRKPITTKAWERGQTDGNHARKAREATRPLQDSRQRTLTKE